MPIQGEPSTKKVLVYKMPILQKFILYKMGPEMAFYMVMGRGFYTWYFMGDKKNIQKKLPYFDL